MTDRITQLTYRNVYCALCHGVDPTASIDLHEKYNYDQNLTVSSLQWWTVKVECDRPAIIEYLENQPDHDKLMSLVSG